jgi:bifunctional enzyme CysN/CysC
MKNSLRFITCGNVDDGKSTLIGRLLWDAKQVLDDHLALTKDSARHRAQDDAIDLAPLVDGHQAESEQSITIDDGYCFFATPRRRFIVADTPGHEQFTCNMVTEASNSELAILVVGAEKGLQSQTLRHARMVALLGIRHLLLAVNKMDLVHWDEVAFSRIVRDFQPLANELRFESYHAIPISALNGDNVIKQSGAAPWYRGPSLLQWLEEIDVTHEQDVKFRMPIQFVNLRNGDFRGYCGRVATGTVRVGDRVRVLPEGAETTVCAIVAWKAEQPAATQGDSIALRLENEVAAGRGSVIASASDPIEVSDHFEARVLCLSDHRLVSGRSYLFQIHTAQAIATIRTIKHEVDVRLGTRLTLQSLELNEVGVIDLSIDRPVPYEPFDRCRGLGSFILIDRISHEIVAAGMIEFPLRRADIRWQAMDISKHMRAQQKLQKPMCLWFTGLPASGKSTIANLLEKRMFAAGLHTYTLDGDNIRHGLNRDLGFTEADRIENIRRITEVARLFVDAGLVAIVSFISPFRTEREMARSRFEPGEFVEVFVDTPLEECERRDPKGLYAKARRGELKNFTGIDSEYQPPLNPEIRLDTVSNSPEECVDCILCALDAIPQGAHEPLPATETKEITGM